MLSQKPGTLYYMQYTHSHMESETPPPGPELLDFENFRLADVHAVVAY